MLGDVLVCFCKVKIKIIKSCILNETYCINCLIWQYLSITSFNFYKNAIECVKLYAIYKYVNLDSLIKNQRIQMQQNNCRIYPLTATKEVITVCFKKTCLKGSQL